MKTIKGKLAVATGYSKDKYPQCEFCGEKKSVLYYTEDDKLVCSKCVENDEEENNS